ncbi:hypothetical protein [Methylobacterium brachythecii]|uniref:Uncharacterized protein n=1 Tax=Methylobacterium brachythecii TaxID=1176177 RepID=A0A7W6AM38_9HYPH|nr:hypothetical protein [Methylobacterium brachythecii]MBB3905126.1 hypothetical protein [Methylobacterium brachythecii]GLS44366.1 hypothetical protein GCM10007884_23540 [Methylobacterium brachythecii]
MAAISWPLSSSPGLTEAEGAGRLINAMVEKLGDGARAPVSRRRVPGLGLFADTALSTPRGLRAIGPVVLGAYRDMLVKVTEDRTVTPLGSLPGSKRITIAHNNRQPAPDVVAVTQYGAYKLSIDTAPMPLTIPGSLPAPNACCELFGFLFFTAGNGTCFASGLNATTFNTLDYTVEQARPGGLLRPIPFRDELFLFGPSGIGVYGGTAQQNGFPLARITGIPRGLIGPWAVAGHEEGWSNEMIWVGDDAVVYKLSGYSPVRLSTHDVERDLAAAAKVDATQIEASVHLVAGHACWVVSMPGRTWVYDLTTGQWHERASHQASRWRASQSVKAFGRWLVGDTAGTGLLEVREDVFTEAGAPLRFRVESLPGQAFPQRIAFPRVDLDFAFGTGLLSSDPTLSDPRALVSWSDDGGSTWSNPLSRSLGRRGATRTRINVLRTGLSGPQGRSWRIDVSDPVYCALLGGAVAPDVRSE